MNWFYVISLYLLVQFCYSIPQHNNHRNGYELASKAAEDKGMSTGCLHNSTMFADTSIIPTSEPCLVCKCSKRNLLCVRRVCKDQPYPPPRGCILVYKKTLCCPYLSCSKYHVNYYKNAERNREQQQQQLQQNNYHQMTHEKITEKRYRTDDEAEDMNGGCIESGSLYASGSAMFRSSASTCTYCYCINGQQKCIKPKCMLRNTKCKPIFMEASCCPIKYDCNNNSNSSATAMSTNIKHHSSSSSGLNKFALAKRKNRSNGCVVGERQFHEGERLPHDDERPCEVCYCIKGTRKCTVKKCAPVIRGCIPKIPTTGSCCPTSYDCRRKRESRQDGAPEEDEEEEEEVEEDTDTIDFFSLLFGSDEPKDKEQTVTPVAVSTTTTQPPPFKALPSTTESSFFDLIRAGLEMIDANADKIDTHLNSNVPTSTETVETTTSSMMKKLPSTTSTESFRIKSTTAAGVTKFVNDERATTKSSTLKLSPTTATKATTARTTTTLMKAPITTQSTASAKVNLPIITTTTTRATPKASPSTTITSSSRAPPPSTTTTKRPTIKTKRPTAAPTTIITTTTSTVRTTSSSKKYIVPSILQQQQQQHRIPVQFSADVLPDTKLAVSGDDNEADTLPNLEIIPFVAHDAIKTDKYEPYRPSAGATAVGAGVVAATGAESLEKDYFAGDKEKPFRYNNKFIHHNYDDTLDYVYTNPHDRIDSGPYYFETNDNQFDAFSPPNEQDFLGGFSPKESIYDEVPSSSTSANYELPLKLNDYAQKTLDTTTAAPEAVAVVAAHENKSNLTSTEKSAAVTLPINHNREQQQQHEQSTVPNFKKISTNFTSFIDDLLQANVLDESTTTTKKATTTKLPPAIIHSSSTSAPIKSIINDDDFIIKHLRASTSKPTTAAAATTVRLMEIFSKPSQQNSVMNGLLKLAGCNIYGQMYEVGHVIEELSNRCLECKCLPDIGVGCAPLKC